MGNCKSKSDDNDLNDLDCKSNTNDSNSKFKTNLESSLNLNMSTRDDDANDKQNAMQSTNDAVIDSTRAEVNQLLGDINQFQGTTETDKTYKYLDEMLTRCILRLDKLECNNSTERGDRKQAIKGVNRAITILEKKLEFNSDVKKLENNLIELGPSQIRGDDQIGTNSRK